MSKRQKILDLFNSVDWMTSPSGEQVKTITGEEFESFGLYHGIENTQQHCDVIYARRIIQQMGHKVLIGCAFHVWKDKQLLK